MQLRRHDDYFFRVVNRTFLLKRHIRLSGRRTNHQSDVYDLDKPLRKRRGAMKGKISFLIAYIQIASSMHISIVAEVPSDHQ